MVPFSFNVAYGKRNHYFYSINFIMFQQTVLKKYLKAQDPAELESRWTAFRDHFHSPEVQENIRSSKEEQYQEGFLRDLFVSVLGYTLNPTVGFNLTTELKNVKDAKKADGGIIIDDKVVGVIELKGTNTTDLGKVELQAFNYKNNQKGCTYVITSNFEKLRFYIDDSTNFIEFSLFDLSRSEFDAFYLLLSFSSIKEGIPEKIKTESISREDIITKNLYKDYSVFKRELFQNLVALNPEFEQLQLFRKSQKLLDRLLFLFFGEDRGLLPPNSVRLILEDWNKLNDLDEAVPLYNRFKKYFGYLNTGFKGKKYDVYAYNGGLFKPDDILDNIKIDDQLLYRHAFTLSEYDFASEIDVNILGHIFENSLNEIDEIKAQLAGETLDRSKTKRKKDGVFYTPKYITKYIVENTIGALCEQKKAELQLVEEQYFTDKKRQQRTKEALLNKLTTYRDWLLQITIIDPACGSGAFLNEALNFLIEEHHHIDEMESKLTGSSFTFGYHSDSILENNLFGLDLNEESVEIAKLSLWLRTAERNRKLSNLNDNIKCGNSLIDDPEIAGDKAFNWEKEFPQVFEKGGFDVVIGNPPYVSVKMLSQKDKEYYLQNYKTAKGQFDLYTLFYERGYQILKEGRVLSYITSNTFISNKDFYEFRKFFLENSYILEIINLGETVFEDANLDVAIFSFAKNRSKSAIKIGKNREEFDKRLFSRMDQEMFISDNYEMRININYNEIKILNKINKNTIELKEILDLPRGIEFGSNSEKIFNEPLPGSQKIIFGKSINRYSVEFENTYCFFEDNISVYKTKETYFTEKILIQRIRNLSLKRRIVATLDDEQYLCTNTLRIGILKNNKFSLKFILALLNSSLINFLFLKLFLNKDIYAFQLQKIPIKQISLESQQSFVENVHLMLYLNKNLQEVSTKFIRSLKRELSLENIQNKLHCWYQLSYADFLKELKKQKVELTLSQKAEWEGYFEQEQSKVLSIQQRIDTTDKEIDKMVYQLYGLSDEEIEIVERG